MAGNRILTLGEVPKDQVYGVKLKGVSVCFTMLKAVLSGNYVNFGVFRLYGDDALDNALQTFIKLLLSIPHSDLLVRSNSDGASWAVEGGLTCASALRPLQDYPKLSQSFYSLLEVLTQDHMNFIASLEPQVVMYILSSISEGLTALGKYSLKKILGGGGGVAMVTGCVCVLDTMVCTGCCSSLDHIVTYLFKQLSRSTKKRPAPMATDDRFLHIMQQHPEMIQQVGDQLQTPHPPTRVCCLTLTRLSSCCRCCPQC